jgi:integrase
MSSVDIHGKPNGRWEVRWREAGRRRGRTFDRKGDATAFSDYVRGRIQRAGIPDLNAGRQPLWQFMEEWWRLYAIPNLAPATRDVYIRLWEKHLEPRVGTYQLRELTPAVIADLRVQLERDVGAPTVIKAMGILQAVCKQAVIHGRMDLNPVAVVDKPRQRPTEAPVPLTPTTVEAIRARLTPFDATLVSVLAYAGLRPQEATALDWRHVSAKRLRVWAPKTRTIRSVDLVEPLADDLLRWRRSTAAIGPVFARRTGTPWTEHDWRNWRRRVYQPAAAAAGVTGDLRPYRLRGSFVSLLLWEGRSVTYVAAQAGHSLQTLSRHYAGVLAELEDGDIRVSATDAIRAARQSVGRGLDAEDAEDAAQGGQLSLDLALDQEAQCRTRTGDPFLTMEVLYQLS